MVRMSTDTLQTVCDQMEEDDPDAEDDEPVSFVVWNTQVAPVPLYFLLTLLDNNR